MKLLSNDIGNTLLRKLSGAIEARIVVAFFNPDDRTLIALDAIPKLSLIVSEEFTVNDPYKLERLKTAAVRSIPPDDANGKLHAKVIIARLEDGSQWAMLGSANLTHQGLFCNQEACAALELNVPSDAELVLEIRRWFDSVFQKARRPNLDQAKLIFDNRARYRLTPRPSGGAVKNLGYWALKTTSGSTGKEHWPIFLAEGAIAVGWDDIPVDPSTVSMAQLRTSIEETYPEYKSRTIDYVASTIDKFVHLKIDDIVLICRGYNSTQEKNVHVYGLARVTGPFRAETPSRDDWRFKHDAVIQSINMDLPRAVVASALKKEALRQTIHRLEKADFDRFARKLAEFGVHVEV